MSRQRLALAGLVGLFVLSLVPPPASAALDAIPLYEPIDIGQMIRDAHPRPRVSSAPPR
jgi:hypothetical protein